ncbi:MAG: DUF2283 domain-containing protein [Chloroflexi bacterium]|nr:DUF2283 domain-containing protein [Chloroflexota bacterium]
MDQQLNFMYDREADVLYVSKGHPEFTDYVELGNNLILRLDPVTKEIVGFTIIDFAGRFESRSPRLSVPLNVHFERAPRTRKSRVVAETKATYSVKPRSITSKRKQAIKK